MQREECWMTFSEALEMYLRARDEKLDAPGNCRRWEFACEDMKTAAEHMDVLTEK